MARLRKMKSHKFLRTGLILILLILGLTQLDLAQAAPRLSPKTASLSQTTPVVFFDDTFNPAAWQVEADIQGQGFYSVQQSNTGGRTFRWIEHLIPTPPSLTIYSVALTHLYLEQQYDPSQQGPISFINYSSEGIILEANWSTGFVNTYLVLVQDGRSYRSRDPIRELSQTWQLQTLNGLRASDFVALDGNAGQPNFSVNGGPIAFGFFRGTSRSLTLPDIPPNQTLRLRHGIDNWRVEVWPDTGSGGNLPPLPETDTAVLDSTASFPLVSTIDPLANDSDPDGDPLRIISISQPTYGSATLNPDGTITYIRERNGPENDSFTYVVTDNAVASSTLSASSETSDINSAFLNPRVIIELLFDCACVIDCLGGISPEQSHRPALGQAIELDLPLIYRTRDQVLKSTQTGRRYVDHYYTETPEIARILILRQPSLGAEAVATVSLWQDNLRNLVDGDGSAVITQAQVEAVQNLLTQLRQAGSDDLKAVIDEELASLGPLEKYVGLTMAEARESALGPVDIPPAMPIYLPLVVK